MNELYLTHQERREMGGADGHLPKRAIASAPTPWRGSSRRLPSTCGRTTAHTRPVLSSRAVPHAFGRSTRCGTSWRSLPHGCSRSGGGSGDAPTRSSSSTWSRTRAPSSSCCCRRGPRHGRAIRRRRNCSRPERATGACALTARVLLDQCPHNGVSYGESQPSLTQPPASQTLYSTPQQFFSVPCL